MCAFIIWLRITLAVSLSTQKYTRRKNWNSVSEPFFCNEYLTDTYVRINARERERDEELSLFNVNKRYTGKKTRKVLMIKYSTISICFYYSLSRRFSSSFHLQTADERFLFKYAHGTEWTIHYAREMNFKCSGVVWCWNIHILE